jgi:DNA polymerase-3 subunit alpha
VPDFVHLHNHSDYSLLDGAASIEKLVAKTRALGMKHLALTDHGNMFGALKFYNVCRENGINPLIGCEFYVAPNSRHIKTGTESGNKYHHLVLLAKDTTGYRNLLRLTSAGYVEGFYYKPRIDDELIGRYREGLIGTSACIAGEVPSLIIQNRAEEALKRAGFYRELLGKDNYYLEVQDHGIAEQRIANRGILELSKKLGIPVVATNDIHYVDREDANAQDILLCIGTGKKKNETARMRFDSKEFYLKTPEEMERLFRETPFALTQTLELAEKCNLRIDLPGPLLPDYEIPKEFAGPEEYLRHLAFEGLKRRYPSVTEDLKRRLDYELDVIIKMQFTGYFLIVWDFIHYARENGIPVGPGRGSGAGSIVAYSLQITDIDPIKYGLLFERFLNPERISMPDFDIDFCFERRQEVIDYVTRKYGKERVGQIITFGTLKAKAVLKDVARVLDIPFAEANDIAKLIPDGPKVTLEKAMDAEPKLRVLEEKGSLYQELVETSRKLEGLSRHASTHAAGIVIGKNRLTDYVPLYRDPKTGALSTQYTMEQLESCGLVKMDFLGLKTLTLIKNTEALIRERKPDFDIEKIPETDGPTFAMLGEGKSACVFQFESQGMQGILKRVKPTTIEELIALNALYRPGPMQYIDQFVDSKWGRTPIKYPLPELESVLKETYGVIVYQEQVMEIARIVGGYSLGQADILRRAMGKKKAEEMEKQKESFLKGAAAKGIPPKKADEIFELLVPFAGYGFNKSHAAAYSLLAYKTAFLKANYTAEFMAANLTNEITDTDKLAEYIAETRELGIEILPPDINRSEKFFTVSEGKILYGFMGIKNMGSAAVDEILQARREGGPFASLYDLLDRVDLKTVNRKVVETGIQCGLFDGLSKNRAALFLNVEKILDYAVQKKDSRRFGQTSLFDTCTEEEFREPAIEESEDWPELERLRLEKEILGFYFSGHPMDRYRKAWEKNVTLDLSRTDRAVPDKTYNLIGMIRSVRVIFTKQGKKMAFALLEDYRGSIELIIFTGVYEKHQARLTEDAIVGVVGKIDTSRGDPKFLVDDFRDPENLEEKEAGEVHVVLSEDLTGEEDFYHLRSFIFEHPGTCALYLHFPPANGGSESKERVLKASSQISLSSKEEVLDKIRNLPLVLEVWKQ